MSRKAPLRVQSSSYEVATTLTQEQVTNLPVFDRQISNLYATQAGVEQNGVPGGSTVINGTRSQSTNVTLDGINVQDQFIRLSGLDISRQQSDHRAGCRVYHLLVQRTQQLWHWGHTDHPDHTLGNRPVPRLRATITTATARCGRTTGSRTRSGLPSRS